MLYAQQLADPVDRLISWLDEIQVGGASLAAARRHRVGAARPRRPPGARARGGDALGARDVRYAYVPGRDVLHGIDLDLGPASASPSSGRPARASRRSAGCSRGSTRRGRERSRSAASRLVELPLETLRQEVALVTQEQHVFVGTLADNLRLARPGASRRASSRRALAAVDALEWAEALPDGPRDDRRRGRRCR